MRTPSLLLLAALALGCTTTEPTRSPPPRCFVALPVTAPAPPPPTPAPITTLTDSNDSLRVKLRHPFALYNLTNVKRPLREILGALGAAIPARIAFDGEWSTEVEATLHVRASFTWNHALWFLSATSGSFDWSVRDGAIHIRPATEGAPIFVNAPRAWVRILDDRQTIEVTDEQHRLLWRTNVILRALASGSVHPRGAPRVRSVHVLSCGCVRADFGDRSAVIDFKSGELRP